MATETKTVTEDLTLTPPDPVVAVEPTKAAGLVPVGDEIKSKLEEKV
ncbi:MAG: toxic anion resistance protein, partial [Pseudomonadota bacterium]